MKLNKNQVDKLNIELTLEISAEDYSQIEKKKLADCRRTADFKGFRKGNVPASLIQKVYGEKVLADAVNECINKGLEEFITENKLAVLGEPMPSENQPQNEWVSGKDFKFVFDIATSPEVDVEAGKDDTVTKYNIEALVKEKNEMKENLKKYYTEKKEEKTDEEIDSEVAERMDANYKQEAEWRLTKDIRDYFVNKAAIELPEAFLKRWLIAANEGKVTAEEVEKEFPGFLEDFRWQLVRGAFMKKFDFKITEEDIREAAKAYVTYQYAMYGIGNVPEEMINEACQNILSDRNQIGRLQEQVEDNKVMTKLRELITIKSKKISSSKFREL